MVTHQKSSESQEQIRILSDDYKCISGRLKELGGILTKVYEDKVKGVIDDETFVLLISEFKKEREHLPHQRQHVREKLEAARKFQSGLDYFKESYHQKLKFITSSPESLTSMALQ